MTDLGTAFLREVLGRAPDRAETGLLVRSYLAEWNEGVRHLPGVGELLTGHLEAMGVRQLFDTVVTSFEVGWRKPHPAVDRAALRELRVDPGSAVFVGDTCRADHEGPTRVGIPRSSSTRSAGLPYPKRRESPRSSRSPAAWRNSASSPVPGAPPPSAPAAQPTASSRTSSAVSRSFSRSPSAEAVQAAQRLMAGKDWCDEAQLDALIRRLRAVEHELCHWAAFTHQGNPAPGRPISLA
ncbi:HAD hydrolase-like protein [Streptomyces albidoflavus]